MDRFLLASALLLSACGTRPVPIAQASAEAVSPATDAAPGLPGSKLVEEKGDLLEFTYGWPLEAAAIPALSGRIEADLARLRAEGLATAREDKAMRPPDAPFHGHYFQKIWMTHGETPRLLSLAAQVAFFTGGAHGNTIFDSLLWDRTAGRPIATTDLFTDAAAAFAAMNAPYCEALDRARVEKRGAPLPAEGEDWLVGCPELAEQVIVPVDADEDGRFERLRVLIPPYEAGPYVEGTYEVDVPVTPAIRALLKPDYAAAF